MSQSFNFRKKKENHQKTNEQRKSYHLPIFLHQKKIYIGINEFYLMRRISLHYFYSSSY
jgi:hypothetical protein